MTTQRTLFDNPTPPRARRTDPETSRIAAKQIESSGKADKHRTQVLVAVSRHPEKTAAELGEITQLGHIECQRRLSDLKRDGLVEQGPPRRCTVKGSMMTTWTLSD